MIERGGVVVYSPLSAREYANYHGLGDPLRQVPDGGHATGGSEGVAPYERRDG